MDLVQHGEGMNNGVLCNVHVALLAHFGLDRHKRKRKESKYCTNSIKKEYFKGILRNRIPPNAPD
jgi:hypothetical protein